MTASQQPTGHDKATNYTSAVPFASESGRVGLVTCTRCGAAILLSMLADSMTVHDEWHKRHETQP